MTPLIAVAVCLILFVGLVAVAGVGAYLLLSNRKPARPAVAPRPMAEAMQAAAAPVATPPVAPPDPAQAHAAAWFKVQDEIARGVQAGLEAEHKGRILKAVADVAADPKAAGAPPAAGVAPPPPAPTGPARA